MTDPQELADAIVSAGDIERRTIDDAFESYDNDAILESYLDLYRRVQASHGLF